MRQIVIDTETTGLYADSGDRIIEFAGLEMVSRRLTGRQCHFYIYPECDINEDASKVHGITLAQLKDKPKFAEIGQAIYDFIKGAELIIHNAPFDIGFLNSEFARMGLTPIQSGHTHQVIDTLVEARKRYPGKRNSLDALCERLGVDISKRTLHGALIDCDLLSQVYLAMTRNQFTLSIDLNNESSSDTNVHSASKNYQQQVFKVIRANTEELVLHEQYLDELGNSLYRNGSRHGA